jgi:hypothetical protein
MNRHIIDQRRADSGARLERFAGIERRTRVAKESPAEALRRAPRQVDSGSRLQRFVRILRLAD